MYNQAVAYDTDSREWSVVDDSFVTADALYLANQDIWISQWGGSFFGGRGVPGRNDTQPDDSSASADPILPARGVPCGKNRQKRDRKP